LIGQVYKGFYDGREVAIKVLEKAREKDKIEEFKSEFQILR
jgi:hypothetical protein